MQPMNDRRTATEGSPCVAYDGLIERYARALDLAENVAAAFKRGESGEAMLEQLGTIFNEIQALVSQIAQAKLAWIPSGATAEPQVDPRMERLTELVARLVERVREAEDAARGRMGALLLQLDDSTRSQRMLHAYTAVMNAGPT